LGPLPPLDVLELAGDAAATLWERQQLAAPALGGMFDWLCLAIAPTSLETVLTAELASRVALLRPVGYDAGQRAEPPEWLASLPDRPLVYGTLGTYLNTDRAVFRAMLDGLADEDVSLVVTVGSENDPAFVGPVPANARVERYVPQSLLLDRCAAMISHAGSGTILPALGRGVPLVLVPQGADNFVNAARCAAAGAGIELRPDAVSADAIGAAVRRVLAAEEYRARAGHLADEISAMPGPDAVIGRLEALARSERP
jgi:MGT family glycosyltransferase